MASDKFIESGKLKYNSIPNTKMCTRAKALD